MVWIVAMTKPNQEAIAAVNLTRQGFEPYYPRFKLTRSDKSSTILCLFPRYMFVKIDSAWRTILSTRGIATVLRADEAPEPINERVILDLKSREGSDGLVMLKPPPKFLKGAKVKSNAGPLGGHLMVYQGMTSNERCMVLAELLGREVSIQMDVKSLIAA